VTNVNASHRTAVAKAIPAIAHIPSHFDALPDSAFVREAQIVQSKRNPSAPLPISAATLWRKVAAQSFPAPVKLSERVTAWRVSDVRAWMLAIAA